MCAQSRRAARERNTHTHTHTHTHTDGLDADGAQIWHDTCPCSPTLSPNTITIVGAPERGGGGGQLV